MRIVIADDSALLREGLAGLVQRQGHDVVALASDAPGLVDEVQRLMEGGQMPDVVITDVRMPPGMATDGLDAAVRLRDQYPHLAIMILSQYVAPVHAARLLAQPGAGFGYLLKDRVSRVADFLRSLTVVAAGGVVIDPEIAARLAATRTGPLNALTDREREVLALMAEGLSNSQISATLSLSAGAVAKYVAAVFLKLGLPAGEDNRRVRAVLTYLTDQDTIFPAGT
ncbi:response regulator transcription factor [Arthrobacter echini]|uniref:Response regulator transcription factor n=1 Tax=Arthrobacter echini TaxID=1529066 RepID=A0A4S5EAI3_9MICC|nr:response regulator transcription factor [Arthrobacter echini]THJ68603.1 response regulator transcription factor [Arthrobacter echini]